MAMNFTYHETQKYALENATEPRTESRGTKNLIHKWREECTESDQIEAFAQVLDEAKRGVVAENLREGNEN